jgi:hypothetical protein
MDDEAELRRLNEATFAAEARRPVGENTWRNFLNEVLDDSFVLLRSAADREDEDKAAIIDAIEHAGDAPERTRGVRKEDLAQRPRSSLKNRSVDAEDPQTCERDSILLQLCRRLAIF